MSGHHRVLRVGAALVAVASLTLLTACESAEQKDAKEAAALQLAADCTTAQNLLDSAQAFSDMPHDDPTLISETATRLEVTIEAILASPEPSTELQIAIKDTTSKAIVGLSKWGLLEEQGIISLGVFSSGDLAKRQAEMLIDMRELVISVADLCDTPA